ncbi:hypothetical protein C8J56DRAFT_882157 [Mycena floridula]|nr:hypothetical protein C8J56DRAFT_882157 [Mycena floridula]
MQGFGGLVAAKDLKAVHKCRKTVIQNLPLGSYVKQSDGTVKWDPKGQGDAEHVIEPGSHVKPVMNGLGIKKGQGAATVDPNRNPKQKTAATDYMAQNDVQDKAAAKMKRIEDAAKKHNNPQFAQMVKQNVNKKFPHARRSVGEELNDLE